MNAHRRDPFEALGTPPGELPVPDAAFVGRLRSRLVATLGIDATLDDDVDVEIDIGMIADLPERKLTMNQPPDAAAATPPSVVVPYLTVADGDRALAWYGTAFGAVEVMRVEAEGVLGHAEFSIGGATFYLSDEFPQLGVLSPSSLGGTSVALHLTVADVDAAFAAAVDAGATSLAAPADQPHGARHGTLVDPFGHRWMLSQPIAMPESSGGHAAGDRSTARARAPERPVGQIWAAMPYADAPAGIRFLTDVLGFEAQIVVRNESDPTVIEHSQLMWPEGGVLQAATANRPGNPYSARPVGSESLYVVTADPEAVWRRCQAADVEVVSPPSVPDYAPDTMVFSIRDPEGNIFSFGSYAGE